MEGGIRNEGTIESGSDGIDIVNSTVTGGITNTVDGRIDSDGIGIAVFTSSTVNDGISNAGTITADDAAIVVTSDGIVNGDITNTGTITGAVAVFGETGSGAGIDLFNSGLLDIGTSESFILGDFTQDMDGTLAITLLGFGDYSFAPLDVDNAFLDGLLDLSFIPGFSLSRGQRFTLLDVFGTRSGVFTNFDDDDLVATFNDIELFIDYTEGGDVNLYTVPTPGALVLLGLGALPLVGRRRRKPD